MMHHSEIQLKLSEYLDHALSEAERRKIEEHLNGCPSCRQELAELEHVVGAIREIPPEEPPPWLTTRIMARVREEATPRPSLLRRLVYPLHIKIPLEAAALICLCITGYYLANRTGSELTSLPSRPPVQEPHRKPTMLPPATLEYSPMKKLEIPLLKKSLPSSPPFPAPSAPSPQAPASVPQPPITPPSAPAKALPLDAFSPGKALPAPMQDMERLRESTHEEKRRVHKELLLSEKDSSAPVSLHLGIRTDNPDRLERDIEETGNRFGGRVLIRESTPTGRTVTVRLPVTRFPAFLTRLEQLGAITERPALAAGVTGELLLTIRLETVP